jgi:hypothetical protein
VSEAVPLRVVIALSFVNRFAGRPYAPSRLRASG